MKKQLQLRSGTTAQHQQFIGRDGEITVDTTLNVPVIHDGATVGGFPVLSSVRVEYGTNFNIITPTITSPVTNSTSFTGTVTSSPYTLQPVFKGIHTSTDWEVATDALFLNLISSSYHDTTNLTRFNVTGLTTATVYIRCRYVSGVHLSSWSPTTVAVPTQTYINAPTLTVQGSPSSVPLNPTLTGSAFSIVGSAETHFSSDWSVQDAAGVTVWSSVGDTVNLTSIQVPTGTLTTSATYTFAVKYRSTTLVSNDGVANAQTVPPSINTPLLTVQGGPSAVPEDPILTGSTYSTVGSSEVHASSYWTVKDSTGTIVWSQNTTTNLTSVQVPKNALLTGHTYSFSVQYFSATMNSSVATVQGTTVLVFAGLNTPTLTVQGGPSSVPLNPTLTGSAFSIQGSTETHVSSDWTVVDSAGVTVWSSLTDSVHLTSIQLPVDTLTVGGTYTFGVVYNTQTLVSNQGTAVNSTIPNYLNAPAISIQGGPSSIPESPILTGTVFSIVGTPENHVNSDWTVTNSLGTVVWSSLGDSVNLKTIQVPAGILLQGTSYTFSVVYNSTTLTSPTGTATGSTLSVFPSLNNPTLTVQGSPSSVPENPQLSGSAFSAVGTVETHLSSDWVVKNAAGVVVWSSLADTVNLTSIVVPKGQLAQNTSYTFTVQYNTASLSGISTGVQGTTVSNFPSVVTPTSTVQGAPSSVPENPLLTGSVFATLGTTETHVSTDWVVTDSAGVTVWSSVGDLVNLETITVPKGILTVNTSYTFTVKYNTLNLVSGLGTAGGTTKSSFAFVFTGTTNTLTNYPTNIHLHAQTTLLDGTILVTGGRTLYNGTKTAACYLYDPTLDVWSATAPLPVALIYHSQSILNDGTVLVTGGATTYAPYNSLTGVYLYDPTAQTWTTKAPLPIARDGHGQVTLSSGEVLVIGGSDTNASYINAVHSYDVVSNTWTLKSPYPSTYIFYPAVYAGSNGTANVLGGHTPAGWPSNIHQYDITTDSWTPKGTFPLTYKASTLGKAIYKQSTGGAVILLGYDGTKNVYSYDFTTNTVTTLGTATLSQTYGWNISEILTGGVLIVGGDIVGGVTSSVKSFT